MNPYALIKAVLLLILLFALCAALRSVSALGGLDLAPFWAASHVFYAGGNPYDLSKLMALYHHEGLDIGQQFWNPPWALPLFLPFALFSFSTVVALWFVANVFFVAHSVRILMTQSGVAEVARTRRFALFFLITALPIGLVLYSGQLSALVMFSMIGFINCLGDGREKRHETPLIAALWLVPTLLKPHLLVLVYFALFCAAIQDRWSRRCLQALLLMTVLLSVLALGVNERIFAFYHATKLPTFWFTASIGAWIQSLHPDQPALRFIPLVIVLVLLLLVPKLRHEILELRAQFLVSTLVPLSIIATPYAWTYDFVLLIPTAIWLLARAAKVGKLHVTGTALCAANLALTVYSREMEYDVWYPLLFPIVALLVSRRTASAEDRVQA